MLQKSSGRQPRKWTVAEDQKLREEVEAQMSEGEVKDWCRVANALPGRTNKDCRKRWFNSVAGGLKKGQWSKNEDLQLARGVQQYGTRWTQVAQLVSSRSADQCAKRWQQSLDPDLDRSEWRESEDKVLIEAVQKLGRHWKDIQRHHFAGRSKNCIKNRYTVLQRRYQNQGITLPDGGATPEPASPENQLATYSTGDDDTMSYASTVYDDLISSHTQVSTPETHNSWPEEPFTAWSSQESFNITPTAPSFAHMQPQASHTTVPSASQWNWSTTAMQSPQMMNYTAPNAYPNTLGTPPFVTYASYSPICTMAPAAPLLSTAGTLAGYPSVPARAPTSSPRNSTYQDAEAMAHFARYGMQHDNPYQYQ